jgi:hypothetical protein
VQAHGWDPRTITAGRSKRKQFRCKLGHLGKPQVVASKVAMGSSSCAVCSGKEILAGFNDLATTHPRIARQAYGWDPKKVSAGSCQEKHFRCKLGHIQKPQRVCNRVLLGPDCCAICYGREVLPGFNDLATTHPEIAKQAHGWDPRTVTAGSEKRLQFRCKFGHLPKPQRVCGKTKGGPDCCAICAGKEIAIGVNDLATTHPEIAAQAYKWDPKTVVAGSNKKKRFRCKFGHLPKPQSISNKTKLGPDSCAICASQEVSVGVNDLATTHPEIAKQAYGWDPRTVTSGSGLVKQFCCKLKHLPKPQIIAARVKLGPDSCAICSNQEVLAGFNCLKTKRPDLAAQCLDDPSSVTLKSSQKLRWRCENGHTWKAAARSRSNGTGCPQCASYGFNPGKESVFYLIHKNDRLKFGIANHNSGRIEKHRQRGWIVLEAINMVGNTAWSLERAIEAAFFSAGIPLGQFREKFDGYTEAWYKSNLSVRSIRGLCRKLGVNLEAFLAS